MAGQDTPYVKGAGDRGSGEVVPSRLVLSRRRISMDRKDAEIGRDYTFTISVGGRRNILNRRTVVGKLISIESGYKHVTYTFLTESGETYERRSLCNVHPTHLTDLEKVAPPKPVRPVRYLQRDGATPTEIAEDNNADALWVAAMQEEIVRLRKLHGGTT